MKIWELARLEDHAGVYVYAGDGVLRDETGELREPGEPFGASDRYVREHLRMREFGRLLSLDEWASRTNKKTIKAAAKALGVKSGPRMVEEIRNACI